MLNKHYLIPLFIPLKKKKTLQEITHDDDNEMIQYSNDGMLYHSVAHSLNCIVPTELNQTVLESYCWSEGYNDKTISATQQFR